MLLTRVLRFSAAHRYWRPDWSEEKNRAVFGPCANPHGHGHDYRLEVTVAGEVDAETGFSAELGALDAVLREEVFAALDHQHLNHAVPEFAEGGRIPTSENVLLWIWRRVAGRELGGARLVRMRLYESDGLWVEYGGEGS
jgi:6-pyruvoyltetrahydropterin/6-carboxytetrahydropterin synthase